MTTPGKRYTVQGYRPAAATKPKPKPKPKARPRQAVLEDRLGRAYRAGIELASMRARLGRLEREVEILGRVMRAKKRIERLRAKVRG